MVQNKPFTTVPPISAVFNFTDFESGVGYVSYQCYNSRDNSGASYHMDNNSFHSDTVETSKAEAISVAEGDEKIIDLDFDTSTFVFPQTINGQVIVNMTGAFQANSATPMGIFMVVTIKKWDGTTETTLGTATSKTFTVASNNVVKSSNFTVPITITNEYIAEGELIRATVELWADPAFTVTPTFYIGHSPFNLDGDIIPSSQGSNYNQTIINIPFKRQ